MNPRGSEDALHTHGLEELSSAIRYRDYLYELIAPHCGESVLEVGAGLGDFASLFGRGRRLILSDTDEECLAALRARFESNPTVDVIEFDLERPTQIANVETVLAINVLEHIENDVAALRAMANALTPAGNIVLFVPAYPRLYGAFDRAVGHVRRYTPKTLHRAVEQAGLHAVELAPVNMLGAIAWWLAVRVGGSSRPRPAAVRIYDRVLVPVTRAIERRFRAPFGQSLLCVAARQPVSKPGSGRGESS